jgi:anti-sigma factor RsiW
MSNMEEKLWNYIDGSCTPDEQQAIAKLIEQDEVYRRKYEELLKLNAEFSSIELDEPPMAFTYNVMETIRTENAARPLKAAINKRIIRGIGLFFVVTISAILIFALASIKWSAAGASSVDVKIPASFLSTLKNIFSGPAMQIFLFFDVVMGLYLLDSYLRKRSDNKMLDSVQTSEQTKR